MLTILTVVEESFWTLCAFVMYRIALIISLKSTGAVYFRAVTNMYPHASRAALFHPVRNWKFQQDDNVPLQHI